MKWWSYPVQWFGKKRTVVNQVKDGRLIKVFIRSIGKSAVVTQVYVQCSKCGEWIEPNDDAVIVKDGMGSTRNEHKQCKNVA